MESYDEALYVIIPAYNEQETIVKVAREWHKVVARHPGGGMSRLVIIDDGSTDRTYNAIMQLKKELPYLVCLQKENSGHGATVLWGYQYALDNNADWVFQTDSDGQTDPAEFEMFWERRYDNDMVIGWRKHRKDGLSRIFVTRTLRLIIRMVFGVKVKDANTPYRLMRADTLRNDIILVPERYNLSNVAISVIMVKKGRRVAWIPITFKARQGGINSINIWKIFKIGCKAISDFRKLNTAVRYAM